MNLKAHPSLLLIWLAMLDVSLLLVLDEAETRRATMMLPMESQALSTVIQLGLSGNTIIRHSWRAVGFLVLDESGNLS
jgi:hypothetical protein